jgi:hypothetical protein
MRLIETASEGLDRIVLCRILTGSFSRSPLAPRALIAMAEEAERAAAGLGQRARRRLGQIDARAASATMGDYYLGDSPLDRYSRLGIFFNFNEATAEYVYDGRAYREVIKRFPNTEEARLAARRLALAEQKLARKQ